MGAAMRYQPQGLARVAQSGLSRGLVFATTDPLAPLSASGHVQTQQGSGFIRSFTRDGRTVAAGTDQSTTGVIVLPAAVRDALVGKPITVAWVCDGARASAQAQAVYCHRDGSTQALYIGSSTTNVQFTVSGFSDVFISMPYVAAATRFVLTADGTTVTLYTDVGIRSAPGAGLPAATTILPSILNRQTGGRGNSSNVANISVWNRALTPAEAAQWQANPWQLFDAGSSSSAYQAAIASTAPAAGGTATTISATTGSLQITGLAASVASTLTINASVGAQTLDGQPATFALPTNVAASVAGESLSGLSASIVAPTVIAGSMASMMASGLAASVSTPTVITASLASALMTGQGAAVSVPTTIACGAATESLAGLPAPISTGSGVGCAAASMTMVGNQAQISAPITISAQAANVTTAGLSASITAHAGINCGAANLQAFGLAASIVIPTVINAGVAVDSMAGKSASVSTQIAINATAGAMTAYGLTAQILTTSGIACNAAGIYSAGLAANINSYIPPLAVNPSRLYVGAKRNRAYVGEPRPRSIH